MKKITILCMLLFLTTACGQSTHRIKVKVSKVVRSCEQNSKDQSCMRKLALANNSDAQNQLGSMYENGQGVGKSYTKAAYWYLKSARQGNITAESNMAFMYANGRGVDQDPEKAVYWWRKAALQGVPSAQDNLGVMYAMGQGVSQSYLMAYAWAQIAVSNGYSDQFLKSLQSSLSPRSIRRAKVLAEKIRKTLH